MAFPGLKMQFGKDSARTSTRSREQILIVDDELVIRDLLATLLELRGYTCVVAASGREALAQLHTHSFDLMLSDIVMPGMDGLELLGRVHAYDGDMPVLMVTATHDISIGLEAIRRGAYDYILKPFEREQLFHAIDRALQHRRLVLENQRYQKNLELQVTERTSQLTQAILELEQSYDYTLEALGGALDLKDAETQGHCKRVTAYTICLARAMGVDKSELANISRGAFLHDIGKMAVPDRILRNPGPLDNDEWAILKQHCDIGYAALRKIPFLKGAAEIVLSHHERYDGNGYPRGLKREEIPLGARIFAVADTLDAMISDRPYRSARSLEEAKEEIQRHAGTQFDPNVVKLFLSMDDSVWWELRENLGEPFQLLQAKCA
jgi:cyclic di-GMP phosphodiesterase